MKYREVKKVAHHSIVNQVYLKKKKLPKESPHSPTSGEVVELLSLSLSLLGPSALILGDTSGQLVELPEAEDLMENRTDTQFLSLESGEGNRQPSCWHL